VITNAFDRHQDALKTCREVAAAAAKAVLTTTTPDKTSPICSIHPISVRGRHKPSSGSSGSLRITTNAGEPVTLDAVYEPHARRC
jgi:hypothetical protein